MWPVYRRPKSSLLDHMPITPFHSASQGRDIVVVENVSGRIGVTAWLAAAPSPR